MFALYRLWAHIICGQFIIAIGNKMAKHRIEMISMKCMGIYWYKNLKLNYEWEKNTNGVKVHTFSH